MKISIDTNAKGLEQVQRTLNGMEKQIRFAASKALNNTAYAIQGEIKNQMQGIFKGGATGFSLRAFSVQKSTKANLSAVVALRDDAPDGGTAYSKALRHLFTGGTRDHKRLEGYLRANRLMPAGMMAVPGAACPLDARGNIRQAALTEMLGVLKAPRVNLRVYRKTGAGKAQKAVGYFVVMPGIKSPLKPGIYKRIETGTSSRVSPMVMFVRTGTWRQFIDLPRLAQSTVEKTFNTEFHQALVAALKDAK